MTDIFNKFFPTGTPDTEKQDIENTYKSYKNYKLPLKNASGTSLDYNIICPNIKNIGNETMIVMLWANEIFNPLVPDTINYKI